MMKLKLSIFWLLASFFSIGQTQHLCRTTGTQNTLSSSVSNQNNSTCVKYRLYFHFFREDDGSFANGDPVISSYQDYIDDRIAELHDAFPSNIRFISTGYEVVDSSNFNSNPSNSLSYLSEDLFDTYANSTDAIDVFFVHRSTYFSENDDGTWSIKEPAGIADGIPSLACAASYSHVDGRPNLFRHELGHCLNLWHTHRGSSSEDEGIPEDPNDCEATGDYVCDTPPNDGLFISNPYQSYVDTFCVYFTGPQLSSPPLTNNVMNVGPTEVENSCFDSFTPGQIARILHPDNLAFFSHTFYTGDFDLAMRDNPEDNFSEPNYSTDDYDNSPDLWVRNNHYGDLTIHQNPAFNHPAYGNPSVRVRITNNGCESNNGNETVSVYWTKANTWTAWPNDWNGPDATVGGLIGTATIPVIPGGESVILSIPWSASNAPSVVPGESTNSCILARINGGTTDPIDEYSNEQTHNLWVKNNNVVLRNLTVFNFEGSLMEATNSSFEVQNLLSTTAKFDFDVHVDQSLLNDAEVYLVLPPDIFNQYNLATNAGVKIHPSIKNAILITSKKATLSHISLNKAQRLKIVPKLNFNRASTSPVTYSFRISQRRNGNNQILGSEHYQVNRKPANRSKNEDVSVAKASKSGQILQIAPQPVSEKARLGIYLSKELKSASLWIYTTTGQPLKELALRERGEFTKELDLSTLKSGSYVVVLRTSETRLDSKPILKR